MSPDPSTDLPQWIFLAISQEPHFSYVDPTGLAGGVKHEVFKSTVNVGVYSSHVNAEAALDLRLGRLREVHVLGQFESRGSFSSSRDVVWSEIHRGEDKHGDQTCWQLIERVRLDQMP